ncbi:hypothetical protein HMF8227_01719 [Saliniradius amylolyticus]|uniref:Polyketide cyclase n=1 Tax=Saliniradius amylolyticus TaxID=2183582 RepID=A0A2S2E3U8_9ALTE|nr:SRPBCC family protein [Saliniradius amylolyticus]AWL12192.1 hypothetical protein HMF8227_01719 [Saliniradius amylolyticus]
MAALKKLLIGVAIILVVFFGAGFLLPGDFKVERQVIIEAPADEIYPMVVDLRQWQRWGVWFKRDPDMKISYSGSEQGVGMISRWKSETEGNGEMEVIAAEPNKRLVYKLRFPELDMGSTGEVVLRPTDQGTRVTWMDYGNVGVNPVNRYFALMMDSLVGPDFESGLQNLKKLAENT